MRMKRLGFPKKLRLTRHREFAHVVASGRTLQTRILKAVVVENGLDYSRLGLRVSSKGAGGSVARNRIKRLLREAFRLHRDRIPSGLDILLSPRGDWGGRMTEEVSESLIRLFWKKNG